MTPHEGVPQEASTEITTLGALGLIAGQLSRLETWLDEGAGQRYDTIDQGIAFGLKDLRRCMERHVEAQSVLATVRGREEKLREDVKSVSELITGLFRRGEELQASRANSEDQINKDQQRIDRIDEEYTQLLTVVAGRQAQLDELRKREEGDNSPAPPGSTWSTILPDGADGSRLPPQDGTGGTEAEYLQERIDVARGRATQAQNLARALANRIAEEGSRIEEIDYELAEIRAQVGEYESQIKELYDRIEALFEGYDKIRLNLVQNQQAFGARVGRTASILAGTTNAVLPELPPIPQLPSELDFLPRRPSAPLPGIPKIAVPKVDVPPQGEPRRRGLGGIFRKKQQT